MDAIVAGTIVYDEAAGCLRLEQGGLESVVIWPHTTRWQEDPPAVVLSGGVRAEPGMSVSGGGGYLGVDHIRDIAGDEVADAATECLGDTTEVAFFNQGSRVDLVDG